MNFYRTSRYPLDEDKYKSYNNGNDVLTVIIFFSPFLYPLFFKFTLLFL